MFYALLGFNISCNRSQDKVEIKTETEAEFQKRLNLSSNEVDFFDYAKELQNRRDYIHAIKVYDIAIERHPNYVAFFFNRATAYSQINSYNEAIEDMNIALRMDENNTSYLNERGIIFLKAEKYKDAIKDFSKVLELKPDFTEALINRGFSKYKLGKKDEGCQDFYNAYREGNYDARKAIDEYCEDK